MHLNTLQFPGVLKVPFQPFSKELTECVYFFKLFKLNKHLEYER